MPLTLLSPPASEPVALAEMKSHLRVTHTDEDADIAALIVAATRAIEARAGLALMPQQWRLSLDAPPDDTLLLPLSPVTALDSVAVFDAAGAAQPVSPSLYEFAPGAPARLRPAAIWPRPGRRVDGVAIDFTAGYADADAVPAPLKQAVKMLAAHFYETRETTSGLRVFLVPAAVDAMLAPFRELRL